MEAEEQNHINKKKTNKISRSNGKKNPQVTNKHEAVPDLSQYLPLYTGETHKDDIKRTVKKLAPRKNKPLPFGSNFPVKCSQSYLARFNTSTPNIISKKSYLDMFYTKMGMGKSFDDTPKKSESSRATCDSFRSARSSMGDSYTNPSHENSFVSDNSTFYLDYIEEDKATKLAKELCLDQAGETSEDNKLKSISQRNPKKIKAFKASKCKITFNNPVPALGGLGPDPAAKEKYENLKKQQSYGQKVSNLNRAKMMEAKVLRELKQEIQKSSEVSLKQ